jgi:hypothetical protein
MNARIWFGARRSVVQIHSPRPLSFNNLIRVFQERQTLAKWIRVPCARIALRGRLIGDGLSGVEVGAEAFGIGI